MHHESFMTCRIAPLLVTATVLLVPAPAMAQGQSTSRSADSITVVVTAVDHDSRALLADADGRFGATKTVRTDWTGEATVTWRRGDSLAIQVVRVGFANFDTVFVTPQADYVQLSVALTRRAQALAATEVTAAAREVAPMHPALAAIEERRQRYKGYYVSPEKLERFREAPILDALRTHIPSVKLDYAGSGGYMAKSNRGPTSIQGRRNQIHSEIIVFVDGVYQPAPELSSFRSSEFVAVDYYPETTVPPQFRRAGAQNGVLLLWTR